MRSGINTTHNKIREHAGSSKKEGSSTGSESSKSSNSNDRPNVKSAPAGKSIISSNQGLLGKSGDGDDPNEDDEDGEKRDKKLKKDFSASGSTVEDESSEDSSIDIEGEELEQGVYWVDSKLENNGEAPITGNARP